MFYYVYKITNLINGKIYVGKRKHKDPYKDKYMGSGVQILDAIKKYGLDNFSKDILGVFSDNDSAAFLEKEIVTKEFVSRFDTYNMHEGGYGGFAHFNDGSPEHLARCSKNGKNNGGTKNWTSGSYEKVVAQARLNGPNARLLSQSEESIKKRSATQKENKHQQGENNSQFGTMWITNDNENMKIKKNSPIPDGWKKGRKIVVTHLT